MSMNGIDISNHQAGLNLAAVPCDFVICKATEGTNFVDKYCDGWVQKAISMGKPFGVYHFATGGSSGRQEAEFFYSNIKGYVGKGILILDWEANAVKKGVAYAKEFLDRLKELTGIKAMIYMSKSVCRKYDWSSVVSGDYGLWCAQYANNNPTGYQSDPWTDSKATGAWKSMAMYQYTSHGRLSGYNGNLDLDIFYGDRNAWNAYATSSGSVAPLPSPAPAPSIPQIAVDGSCGPATVRRWQEVMGTTVDGVISGQLVPNQKTYWRPNLVTSCVRYGGTGSDLIRAVQARLGLTQDGLLGPATIKAIQKHYGLTQDASFGPATVKALQRALNKGTF